MDHTRISGWVICCEEADNTWHETVKQFMTIQNFGATVSKIDRRKSEEERLAQEKMEERIVKFQRKGNIESPSKWPGEH
jgi:hypothetical protein